LEGVKNRISVSAQKQEEEKSKEKRANGTAMCPDLQRAEWGSKSV